MSTLHIINQSPFGSTSLEQCLSVCLDGDSILFTQDGVLVLQNQAALAALKVDYYVLTEDAQARGLEQALSKSGAKAAGYDDFVKLVCSHKNSVTWS
jgi:tRNA 2-thiouridine synthesizing protein B